MFFLPCLAPDGRNLSLQRTPTSATSKHLVDVVSLQLSCQVDPLFLFSPFHDSKDIPRPFFFPFPEKRCPLPPSCHIVPVPSVFPEHVSIPVASQPSPFFPSPSISDFLGSLGLAFAADQHRPLFPAHPPFSCVLELFSPFPLPTIICLIVFVSRNFSFSFTFKGAKYSPFFLETPLLHPQHFLSRHLIHLGLLFLEFPTPTLLPRFSPLPASLCLEHHTRPHEIQPLLNLAFCNSPPGTEHLFP